MVNGGFDNAALTGNLVAAIPGEDFSSSNSFVMGPALETQIDQSRGLQKSTQDKCTIMSAAEQTDANPEAASDFFIAQSSRPAQLLQNDSGGSGEPVRQNPNLGWETPGAFRGFPQTVDVEASMQDPATRGSNGFMDYYEQPKAGATMINFLNAVGKA